MKTKYVVYRRVSTQRQNISGLGLEAQTEAVSRFIQSSGGEIVTELTEIETGKKADRPVLLEAIVFQNKTVSSVVIDPLGF